MRHPEIVDLAMYAGGELSLFRKWTVGRHVARCAQCASEVESFDAARQCVNREANDLPEGIAWNRLASEMRGNIHVGLAAGEAVATPEREPVRLTWRMAAAASVLSILAASAWWVHLLAPVGNPNSDVILAATPAGIELTDQDASFTLLNTTTEPVVVTVGAEGSIAARNYDDESGLVTINSVYVE